MNELIIFLSFLGLVAIIILIRVRSNNKFEIKTNDLVVALVPIVLILFLTGQIDKIKLGDLEIEKALKEAYTEDITNDVSDLNFAAEETVKSGVQPISTGAKGGIRELEVLINRKVEGLTFRLGYSGYSGRVIRMYFDRLPSLKYVVINDNAGNFYGLLDAQVCIRHYNDASNDDSWYSMEQALINNDQAYISGLPSFVGTSFAIGSEEKRLLAMEKFKSSKMSILPVMQNDQFVGILERDNLANEILVSLSNAIAGTVEL